MSRMGAEHTLAEGLEPPPPGSLGDRLIAAAREREAVIDLRDPSVLLGRYRRALELIADLGDETSESIARQALEER